MKKFAFLSGQDAPGFLSNLGTKPGVKVDTSDGCNDPMDMSPYTLEPAGQPLHQGAMNTNEKRLHVGNRSGRGKTLTVD